LASESDLLPRLLRSFASLSATFSLTFGGDSRFCMGCANADACVRAKPQSLFAKQASKNLAAGAKPVEDLGVEKTFQG